jgi:hypothetical protein
MVTRTKSKVSYQGVGVYKKKVTNILTNSLDSFGQNTTLN